MRGDRLGMEFAAAVDHDMDGQQRHPAADMGVDDLQRAGRQRGGDDGHHDQIGGAQHLLGRLGQPRRAVEDDPVIIVEPVDQLA